MNYDREADELLQELYCNLYSGAPAPKAFCEDRLRPFIQACGIAYEREFTSLVPDTFYDAFAEGLGDAAATAMDWKTYPPEAGILAMKLIGARTWREHYLKEGNICRECPWSWDPENVCDCRWMEMMG